MKYRLEDHVLHIHLPGDVLSTGVHQIREQMDRIFEKPEVVASKWALLNLDLSAARIIDSMGLNFLVGMLKFVNGKGAKMRITIQDSNLDRLLRFTRLHEHAEVVRG